MFIGAHAILYSKNADADRAFLRDVLEFTHVDVGGGSLIFGLPPAEVAVHPTEGNGSHELYLMCADVEVFRAEMERRGVATAALQRARWGILTDVALPGGGKLGVYQPLHARPAPPDVAVNPAGRSGTTVAKLRAKPSAAKPPAARVAARLSAAKAAAKGAARPPAAKPSAGKPSAAKATGKPSAGKPSAGKLSAGKPSAAKATGKPSAAKGAAKR